MRPHGTSPGRVTVWRSLVPRHRSPAARRLAAAACAFFLAGCSGDTAQTGGCTPNQAIDWIVSALVDDPLAAAARPADCAIVEQNPPDFGWPHAGGGPYTLELAFPGGRTETRTTGNNWFNWNGTLPAGSYTWSVTRAGLRSIPRRFAVSTAAVPFVAPDIETVLSALLAKPHPRGMPDVSTLAAMAAQRDFELGVLRFSVDRLLGELLPPEGNRGDGDGYDRFGMRALWSLIAYAYDRTDIYREDAKRRVLNLASWNPRGPTADDDQESRFVAWVVTVGYDWVGADMSAAEREQLLAMLQVRIGDLHAWVTGTRGWPPGDPGAGIPPPLWQTPRDSHRNVTATVVAAMSTLLVGELPEAETWLRDLLPFTINALSPWSGEEGGYANGTAYAMWDAGALLTSWYALRLATCDGPACIDMGRKAWVRNWGRFIAYFVPPTYPPDPAVHDIRKIDPGTPIGLFGDGFAQPELFEARARFVKSYANFAPSPFACWLASELTGADQTRAEYLMSPPATCAAPAAFPAGASNSLYLPSIGWLAMHSNLADPNRTSVYFKSSPRPFGAFNHQSADQNGFVINAGGERLAIESGYFDAYGSDHWQYWVKRTRSKNAITFDGGQGQLAFEHLPNPFAGMGYGSIVRRDGTDEAEIVAGDATQAYNGALTRALRTLVFVRPGTILVHDTLASNTARKWEWNIHALSPFTVISGDRRVRIARGTQSLCIDLLAGPPSQFVPTAGSDFDSWGRSNDPANDVSAAPLDPAAPAQYHGKFTAIEATTAAEFVVLMRVNASCDSPVAGTQTLSIAAATVSDRPGSGPCESPGPSAARANGVWTVRADGRTITIAADGDVTVGSASRETRTCPGS